MYIERLATIAIREATKEGRVLGTYSSQYSANEMDEVFTKAEQVVLARGEVLKKTNKYGVVSQYICTSAVALKMFA